MMRVTDYIARHLVKIGVRHVFMITGGGAMHLNDSLGRQPGLEYVCCHHEQACAMAAEGYSRASGRLAVVNVTTGPGGLNTLNGVLGQWTDSVPVLYLSGQVKFETTIQSCPEIPLRQLGDQEADIIRIVQPLTKFAVSLRDPRQIRHVLEKAIYLATHGRPGPVWIDLPMNVQGALVDETQLEGYSLPGEVQPMQDHLRSDVQKAVQLLRQAKRPVIVSGHGIRIAGAIEPFLKLAQRLGIPLVTTFNGFDSVPDDHPLFVGRIGTVGTRAGNFALQNADVILSIGSRNNIRQISYGWQTFGRAAVKIVVDIDKAELQKPTLKPDLPIQADALAFIEELDRQTASLHIPEWVDWCLVRKKKYPAVLPEYSRTAQVHPYVFMEALTRRSQKEDIIVAGDGTACVALFQAGHVKAGQRIFWNSGCASMGYDLPASIGACIGSGRKNTLCLAGDGSLQMNIQELQTIAHHQLPLKLFVLSNDGYLSIKQTQANFFGLPYIGCNANSGVSFPDIRRLAEAYHLHSAIINSHDHLEKTLDEVLRHPGPVVCDVRLDTNYVFAPKLSSEKKPDGRIVSKPLEDMYPFLERAEFLDNMLIEPWDPDQPQTSKPVLSAKDAVKL